jgi:tRNA A64-2'-O-ribosylphosphate transferase
MKLTAHRRYVYQLHTASSEARDAGGEEAFIQIRFFDDSVRRDEVGDEGEGVGGLFVEMGGLSDDLSSALVAKNRAQHLCGEDLYAASWRFGGAMVGGEGEVDERWWEVRYDVKGPRKEYVSTTRYTNAGAK